ncbi:hypothetical protein Hanom_Chr13g01193141 [Helianthus anomalus]
MHRRSFKIISKLTSYKPSQKIQKQNNDYITLDHFQNRHACLVATHTPLHHDLNHHHENCRMA